MQSASRAKAASLVTEEQIHVRLVTSTRLRTRQNPPAFLALWVLFAPMEWIPALLVQIILLTQVGVVIVKLVVRMRS